MSFNWCFIGTGKIAHKVAKELVTNPGHKIVSVYNRTKSKAESFALKYNAKVYDSAFEAINDSRVDGVYIATTNETHFEFCKLCLYNRVPVLCEKPITGNAKELEELIRISKSNDAFLKEAMWTWFNPVANKVKEWIKEERIGKIQSVECIFNFIAQGLELIGDRQYDRISHSLYEVHGGAAREVLDADRVAEALRRA